MKITDVFDIKFLKFIIVGIINTLVGSAIMFSLYNIADFSYWVSSACNYFFASILSFFLNKYFTFAIKKWNLFMAIAFIINIVFSYFIAYGFAKPAMNYLLQDKSQNIRENIALFVGMCLFACLNYLGQRFIVFKMRDNED
jgi:putative flippase GtrA